MRIFLFIAAFLLSAFRAQAMDLTLSKSDQGRNATLIANGEIGTKDGEKFRKILMKQAAEGRRTLILFTSHGGALEAVRAIGEAIVDSSNLLFKRHKVSNIFAVNQECSSACTILTSMLTSKRDTAALDLVIDPGATFGFHGPADRKGQNKMIAAYAAQFVSAKWLEENDSMLRKRKMTDKKAAEVCAWNIGILPGNACRLNGEPDLVIDLERRLGIVHFGP